MIIQTENWVFGIWIQMKKVFIVKDNKNNFQAINNQITKSKKLIHKINKKMKKINMKSK